MIQANELRIGNLVYYKLEEIVVTMIGKHGIQSKTDDILINAKFSTPDIYPIPLTEEWLLKFGFKYDKPHDLFSKYGFDIQLLDDGIEFYIGEYGSYFTLLNYVHQLQNLYFALTQTELELKQI